MTHQIFRIMGGSPITLKLRPTVNNVLTQLDEFISERLILIGLMCYPFAVLLIVPTLETIIPNSPNLLFAIQFSYTFLMFYLFVAKALTGIILKSSRESLHKFFAYLASFGIVVQIVVYPILLISIVDMVIVLFFIFESFE